MLFALALPVAHGDAAELEDHPLSDIEISVCKVDLRKDALRMFWKDDEDQVIGTFTRLQAILRNRREEIVCAMNAGIYDRNYRPLGLYIENGKVQRPLNTVKNAYGNFYLQPNGVFLIRNRQAAIVNTDYLAGHPARLRGIRFATQSGPLMLYDGKINPVFSETAGNRLIRNVVCVVSPHQAVLAISRGPVSFYDFALFLRDKLHCTDALYLDGNISRMYPGIGADFGAGFGAMIAVTSKASR
jgi:uncharacterized protein YigE (DUF2233 family)